MCTLLKGVLHLQFLIPRLVGWDEVLNVVDV